MIAALPDSSLKSEKVMISLLENEIRTADDQKPEAFGKHRTDKAFEDQNRNSNINDRPAQGI